MSTLNEKLPYATVYGHDTIKFQQNGKDYGGDLRELISENSAETKSDLGQSTPPAANLIPDPLENQKTFLKSVLAGGRVSKPAIYNEAQNTLLIWDKVMAAAAEMKIEKTTEQKIEYWRLPEAVA